MVEQKPTNVLEIFNSSMLEVPRYQRNYSWRTKHVEDLLNDIDYLFKQDKINGSDDNHYFGTIVLHKTGMVTAGSDEFTQFDIVDGQQRLTTISMTMGAIAEAIHSLNIDSDDLKPTEDRPEKQYHELREIYVQNNTNRRLNLHNHDKMTYKRLVVEESAPDSISTDTISEERLQNAKRTIASWLDDKQSDADSDMEFYKDLLILIRLINNRFEVTRYKVDSISEAGRIFETLNDRGRTLTIADKIKSYLVYCANRIGDDQLADDVFHQFGKVIRNITTTGSESDLTQFIEEHWRMFSGEIQYTNQGKYEINDLHRRIKTVDDHIPLQRSNTEIRNYIEEYLKSLLQSSESYQKVMYPSNIDTQGDEVNKAIQTNLQNIHRNISKQNIVGLLIALHQEFEFSEEFREITELLDSFGWRSYQVCRASTDFRRRKFKELSHQIYYTDDVGTAVDIFAERGSSDFDVFDSQSDAFRSVCREVENAIGSYGPNRSFEKNLRRSDIFDGDINEDGWNGLRNKEIVQYFLYEYELSYDNPSLPEFETFTKSGGGIEHILPEKKADVTDDIDIDHAHYANRLGNLALLHESDEDPDPSNTYAEKYRSIYSSSPMNMLQDLPDPDETTWGEEEIEQRTEQMVEFALERWSVETGAYVPLVDIGDNLTESTVLSSLHPMIESRFNGLGDVVPDELNNLPKVVRDPEFDYSTSAYADTCPDCGGFGFEARNVDNSIKLICECGTELEEPPFALHLETFELTG